MATTPLPPPPLPLDFWNYFFFILELICNISFIIAYPFITYVVARQKTLHINFRVLLEIANIGHIIGALQRSTLIVDRMCCIGNETTDFVFQLVLTYFIFIGMYLFTGGWVGLVLERVYASFKATSYEKKCRSCLDTGMIAAGGVVPAILVTGLKALNFQGTFDFILLGIEITVDVASAIALVYLLRYNQNVYKGRHDNNLALTGRYQLAENIRATTYVLPVAIFDLIGRSITCGLIMYSIFFTDIPLGQDTGHISHAYDMTSALKRLFFGIWLLVKNEKLVPARKRKATVHVEALGNDKYFDDLKKQWE